MRIYFYFLFLILLSTFIGCNPQSSIEIEPIHEGIYYIGRWKNMDSFPQCTWQSSSITTQFKGTSISATFSGGTENQDFRVIIDNDAANAKRLTIEAEKKSYILAENLPAEIHKVELIKETYNGKGFTTFYGFTISGKGIIEWNPKKSQLKCLFYGDSNMDGTSLESEKNRGVNSAYYGFAGVASRMLNAEYQNLSVGGAVIANGKNSGLWFHNRIDRHSELTDWDYRKFSPDVIVINLGANDIGKRDKNEIKSGYKKLLLELRKTHGSNPYIILMNGYGWSRDEPANYTHEVVTELDDARLSSFVFPWLFNEWHGCEYDHAGMAEMLVEHIIATVPGVKQINPIDNLNGFGKNGDVANGSFEEAAHFGGYGWRYFEDGAERIHNKNQAADGEYYIRLKEGTEIHQPNPAEGGVEYMVSVKMRSVGQASGGQVIIEYRDQEYRNEIPDSRKVFTINPDENWQEYTTKIKAPDKLVPPNPSFDVWQIRVRLKCESGIIDVDDVKLSHL
jgi:lysophospholipase L1-like esterase